MLTLTGWIHFYRGTGSMADHFLGLALEDRPKYRLAELLREVARTGNLAGVARDRATGYRKGA
jgi:DNA-binding phage protein